MLREMIMYIENFGDYDIRKIDTDSKRNQYLRAAKTRSNSGSRNKKRNMLHVKKATKQKHRKR